MPVPYRSTMNIFGTSPSKQQELLDKMRKLGISESDIIENFIRSGGKGGQHVNKTSTCVYLRHVPTGTEVKCSRDRSQALNRFYARRILTSKIEEMVLGKKSEERQRVEKIRRQKRKRSKRAKEKMLAGKRARSEKKSLRRHAGGNSEE